MSGLHDVMILSCTTWN